MKFKYMNYFLEINNVRIIEGSYIIRNQVKEEVFFEFFIKEIFKHS